MSKRLCGWWWVMALVMGACATVPEPVEPGPTPDRPVEAPPAVTTPRPAAEYRVGVVVSRSGSAVLQRYAEQVLEGARLAAANAGRQVELVIVDDGGTTGGAERAIRELERQGVRVVVGPLLDESLTAAARARADESMTLISPTAISQPVTVRNTYALNVVDARGATALGEYARRYTRVGVLYPRSPEESGQARAFMTAYGSGRGTLTDAGFDPGVTNVAAQLTRLRNARVEAVYFPASERALNLVLPQLEYYGLADAQMMGNENWLGDAGRTAPPRVIEGAIIATSLWRESADVAWSDFVALYEAAHRRTLDSAVPALGYDAVNLAVRSLVGTTGEFRGATGVLNMQADGVTRRPFLVRIQSGRLVPVN
jgi:ABC-type branched-subunit amino acid transport system substrate-binding protein